jgi:cobalamin biosynthesis Mg chelatase CobN
MQGIVSASALVQSTEQSTYSSGGGGSWSRKTTETETGEETEEETETEPDKGVINATETTGVSKTGEELKKPPEVTSEKRGKVMKEEKPAEEASPAFPISGAPLMGIIAVNDLRLAVSLVLVLFMAQIFAPFVVAQAQSEDNDTAAMAGNLTLPANVSETTALNTSYGAIKRNRITFVLGTDENLFSLENASIDAAVNATIEVMIYNATEAKSADFSNESVVFLASLDNETVASINQTLNESAYVFVYNLTTNASIGDVDDVNITKYWAYGSDENIVNLVLYMNNTFYGGTAPVDMPKPPENRAKIAFVLSRPCAITLMDELSTDPFVSTIANVTTYFGRSDVNLSYNLSNYDVILLRDLDSMVVEKLTETVNDAKNNGAHVIAIGPSVQSHNLHNVNLSDPEYSEIAEYLEYPSRGNFKRLVVFVGVKFCNFSVDIVPPISRPVYGIYHPYAPSIFTDTTDYLKWYTSIDRYNQSNPTVGIMTTSYKRMERDSTLLDALIESFESRNVNVIVSTYAYKDPTSINYLMVAEKPVVDSIIVISRGSPLNYRNGKQVLMAFLRYNLIKWLLRNWMV